MRSRGRGRVIPPSEKRYVVTLELTESERNELIALGSYSSSIAKTVGIGGVRDTLISLQSILDNVRERVGRKMPIEC